MRKVVYSAQSLLVMAEAVTAAGVEIAKSEVRFTKRSNPLLLVTTMFVSTSRRSICNIRCYRCCRIIIKVLIKKTRRNVGFLFSGLRKYFGYSLRNKKCGHFDRTLFYPFGVLNYKPNTANNTQIV